LDSCLIIFGFMFYFIQVNQNLRLKAERHTCLIGLFTIGVIFMKTIGVQLMIPYWVAREFFRTLFDAPTQ
jgi:hypothetical protein